jgi:ribosomal protein S12 methylthiotransferase
MIKEKVSVITLGCSKNTVDSERLLRQLQLNNHKIIENPELADTVIINTCGFIEKAREESVNTIINAVALKKQGRVKKIIVMGCLVELYKDELQKEIPEVNSFFGTENYDAIVRNLGGELKYELLSERVITTPGHTAYLKISEGCDNSCSFCSIPLMRGKYRSKTIEELVKITEFLAGKDTKELVIIAQDTTDYGRDIYGKRNLAELLNRLSEVEGIEWIRLLYTYPSHFPDDLIDTIANNPKICKYIDLPLQHISDDVLKSMRRGITKRMTIELLNKLRDRIHGLILRTTFITGYPNEDITAFEELCSFVNEFKFERLGVFTYSLEKGTPVYILGDKVTPKEKEKRKNILMNIQQEISLEKNKELVGNKPKVLVDRIEGDFYVSRSYREAPEVDGEILIPKTDGKLRAGNFYDIEIYDYNEYDLYARKKK